MNEGDDPDPSKPEIDALRITREESREVLNHHIELLNETDDTALRTLRTAVVIISILVSAAGIAGPDAIDTLHWAALIAFTVGVLLLFVCAVIGIGILTLSSVTFGIRSDHRRLLTTGDWSEREWLTFLLDEYDGWTTDARETNARNADWLVRMLFCLLAAIVALGVGGGVMTLQLLSVV